jgi:hypothetical protein
LIKASKFSVHSALVSKLSPDTSARYSPSHANLASLAKKSITEAASAASKYSFTYNGKPVPDEQNVEYYWGIEDFKVNSVKHDAYNGYLSKGWRCLNEFEKEIIDDEDEDNYVINWKPATNTHWVEYQTPMSYQTRYKLAIVYNNIVQTKTITIKNIDGVDQIKI